MDPITVAIVAAVTAGVTAGGTKVVEKSLTDAYEALKRLILNKFGADKLPKAIADVEGEPNFKPYQEALSQRIEAANVQRDPEIHQAANSLLDLLKARPAGAQAIQHIQNVYGDYSAAAGAHGTATVNVNQPTKKE